MHCQRVPPLRHGTYALRWEAQFSPWSSTEVRGLSLCTSMDAMQMGVFMTHPGPSWTDTPRD